jgi:hypothetical protein
MINYMKTIFLNEIRRHTLILKNIDEKDQQTIVPLSFSSV